MIRIKKTWEDFKTIQSLKSIGIDYEDKNSFYEIWFVDGGCWYVTYLNKTEPANTDQLDFETNYKDNSNKPSKSIGPDYSAEIGNGFKISGNVTSINTGSYTTIITRTTEEDVTEFYTDICFSATQNGIVRLKINGNPVCVEYYGAYRQFSCAKRLPDKINSGSVVIIEYKPNIDGASASCSVGGYSK